jgi:hypothetical protein
MAKSLLMMAGDLKLYSESILFHSEPNSIFLLAIPPPSFSRTEIQCLAVDKARMNSTVPCTLGRQIENRQSRLNTVADVLHTVL